MTAYIGFSQLDQFMAALDREHQVYLAPISIVKNGEMVNTCTVSLIVSQPQRDSLIYCKIDISRWQEISGKPFGQESEERAGRSNGLRDQMWNLIVEQMRADDPDLELYDGAPSFPTDLMLVPGHIAGIAYDADLHEFVKEAG